MLYDKNGRGKPARIVTQQGREHSAKAEIHCKGITEMKKAQKNLPVYYYCHLGLPINSTSGEGKENLCYQLV